MTTEPWVIVRVSDTGVGMNERTQARLFEPFFTTKPPGSGTGLGLSSVYGILTQFGGRVDVKSAPSEGTTFMLSLPQVKRDATETRERDAAAPPRGSGEMVLIVEDDSAVRALTARLITRLGYQVREAAHGADGLEIVGNGGIDLVLCDITMPVMGGLDFLEAAAVRAPLVPVLLMTGHTADTTRLSEAVARGIPLLEKPFTESALAVALRGALGAAR
jgi:CheY-like chemotaxis protein